ncbi:Sporulation protein YpeB [compost metagenome]
MIYPEKIVVKVALDNGEVSGLQAADYLFEHKERQFPKPGLTAEQAKKELNPKFTTESQSLAWIKNDLDQQVLCYEFIGRINGSGYRIYVNADTGAEEKIEEFRDGARTGS